MDKFKMSKRRIIFINLHGNEFLVKTLNKIIFGQSAAVKHRYLLDYLMSRKDIEVCTFINRRGLSLSYTTQNPLLQSFRFLEHKLALRKNGINPDQITVISKEEELRKDDVLIGYSLYSPSHLSFKKLPDCIRVISQIHYGTDHTKVQERFQPHAMYNEADLHKYSGQWQEKFKWFKKEFITIPFVFEDRFQRKKAFADRLNKAISVGTITYMDHIVEYYGDPCAQPARRLCRDLAKERPEILDSVNCDYAEENQNKAIKPTNNPIVRLYRRLDSKINGGHQKQYFSFNMVDKLNDYKIALCGEEIMGIPGIGFVEAMACGCAYIGQKIGYYEDYGMQEGVHYIGYDGTKEDLIKKLEYWENPENQEALEKIADAGYEFVRKNFNKEVVAKQLVEKLLSLNEGINIDSGL